LTLIIPEGHMPALLSVTVIGSKFAERTDPAALVIGPTGLGVSGNGRVLYVADSLNNRIAAIENPENRKTSGGIGETVTEGGSLNDPLGLTVAADGNILTVDGDDGYLVATTPEGKEIGKRLLDDTGNPPGNGALFGLATASGGKLYYVDDVSNTLNLFQ
jgi:sugar lactone lactonase YvrE